MQNKILKTFFLMMVFLILPNLARAADGLLQSSDLTYLGAFKLPTTLNNGTDFSYGAESAAYNPTNNSLYVTAFRGGVNVDTPKVAEVSIPALKTGAFSGLDTASFLQGFYDITEGNTRNVGSGGSQCFAGSSGQEWAYGSLMVFDSKLVGTVFNYYDGGHCQELTHFYSGKTLATAGDYNGMYSFSGINSGNAGYVVKGMTEIPSSYRDDLDGSALVGGTGMSIVGRTSFGPSAFAFDPNTFGSTASPIINYPLLWYDEQHQTIGGAQETNGIWNRTTRTQGMHWIQGTRSIIFAGTHGHGTYCYGEIPPCSDPSSSYAGEHSTAWRYQLWAYDANDLIDVKNGVKQPWQLTPYATMTFTLPYGDVNWNGAIMGGGNAYDPVTQRLYMIQHNANDSGYPAVHAYQLNVAAAPGDTIVPAAPTGLSVQ